MNYKSLFSEKKAAQSAAFYLFKANSHLPVLKLMKLLYLAERKSLELFGYPIIGDRMVSMNNGPVLSMTLDLINGFSGPNQIWDSWVSDREEHNIALMDPSRIRSVDDLVALSESDIEALELIWDQFGSWEKYALRDYTHQALPEWKTPSGSSYTIEIETVLSAIGLSEEDINSAIDCLLEQSKISEAFANATIAGTIQQLASTINSADKVSTITCN